MIKRAAAVIALLALSGCGGSRGTPAGEREVIVLGAVAGPGAATVDADQTVRAARLAVREYNRNPDSTYQVSVVTAGGKGADPAAFSKQLAGRDRLIGVVAGPAAGPTEALGAAFQPEAIPLLSTTAASAALPGEGWRHFRRLVATERAEGAAVAEAVARKAKSGAVIFHDNSPAGRAFGEGAQGYMEKTKRPVARFERISAKTALADLAGAVAVDPQAAVVYGGDGSLGIRFAAEMRKVRFKGPLGLSGQALAAKAGTIPDGLLSASSAADPADSRIAGFKNTYARAYDSALPANAVEAYEGSLMLLEAIEEVDPKGKSVTAFFGLNRRFVGDSKIYEFDDRGELKTPAVWPYESRGGVWRSTSRSAR